MNKLSSLLLASSLVFLPACGGGSDTTQVENTAPVPKPEPEVNNQSTPENITPPANRSLSNVSGLIPSTNPNERLKQVEKGKSNPFSNIRPPSVVKVTPTTKISSDNTAFRDKAIAKVDSNVSVNNEKEINGGTGTNVIDMKNQLESSPTIDVSSDAQEVLVSGVLQLQGENIALIQAPWDATPRSVRVGDIISDSTGSINVQVKEISFQESTSNVALIDNNQTFFRNLGAPNGVVVLEQDGQLVTKEVLQ